MPPLKGKTSSMIAFFVFFCFCFGWIFNLFCGWWQQEFVFCCNLRHTKTIQAPFKVDLSHRATFNGDSAMSSPCQHKRENFQTSVDITCNMIAIPRNLGGTWGTLAGDPPSPWDQPAAEFHTNHNLESGNPVCCVLGILLSAGTITSSSADLRQDHLHILLASLADWALSRESYWTSQTSNPWNLLAQLILYWPRTKTMTGYFKMLLAKLGQ